MCSENWSPGTLVAIGLNSPRIAAGASGFMSHMSSWLGPPLRKTRMHASAFGVGPKPVRRASSALSRPGRPRPQSPIPPTWSIRRRETGTGPRAVRRRVHELEPPRLRDRASSSIHSYSQFSDGSSFCLNDPGSDLLDGTRLTEPRKVVRAFARPTARGGIHGGPSCARTTASRRSSGRQPKVTSTRAISLGVRSMRTASPSMGRSARRVPLKSTCRAHDGLRTRRSRQRQGRPAVSIEVEDQAHAGGLGPRRRLRLRPRGRGRARPGVTATEG